MTMPTLQELKEQGRNLSKNNHLSLQQAYNQVALKYGYSCWASLKSYIEEVSNSYFTLNVKIHNPMMGQISSKDIFSSPGMRMDAGYHLRPKLIVTLEESGVAISMTEIDAEHMVEVIQGGLRYPDFTFDMPDESSYSSSDLPEEVLNAVNWEGIFLEYVKSYNEKMGRGNPHQNKKNCIKCMVRCHVCDEVLDPSEVMSHDIMKHDGLIRVRDHHKKHCSKGCNCRIIDYERMALENGLGLDSQDASASNLFEKVCIQFGSLKHLNPPMPIPQMITTAWQLLMEPSWKGKVYALVPIDDGRIGIAIANEKGYSPTPAFATSYKEAGEACMWYNEHILGLTERQSMEIITSTMREGDVK